MTVLALTLSLLLRPCPVWIETIGDTSGQVVEYDIHCGAPVVAVVGEEP